MTEVAFRKYVRQTLHTVFGPELDDRKLARAVRLIAARYLLNLRRQEPQRNESRLSQ